MKMSPVRGPLIRNSFASQLNVFGGLDFDLPPHFWGQFVLVQTRMILLDVKLSFTNQT